MLPEIIGHDRRDGLIDAGVSGSADGARHPDVTRLSETSEILKKSLWIGQQRDDRDRRDHGMHQHQHRLGARRHARKSVRLGKAQPMWQCK